MTYIVRGIDPGPWLHLFGAPEETLKQQRAVRVIADSDAGFPCRVSLSDATAGESLLLVNHSPERSPGPYSFSYAIFLRERAQGPATYEDKIPPVFETRVLSLRGFDRQAMVRDVALSNPGGADVAIRKMLEQPEILYIDVHNAMAGCFSARVERNAS